MQVERLDGARVGVQAGADIARKGIAAFVEEAGHRVVAREPTIADLPADDVDLVVFEADADSVGAAAALARAGVALVALVPQTLEGLLYEVIDAGVLGVLHPHQIDASDFRCTLDAAWRGQTSIPSGSMPMVLRRAGHEHGSVSALVDRERAILRLLSDGNDTHDIADVLGYSAHTVKNVIHDLLVKLNCRNRAHAVGRAARLGLL